MIKTIQKTLLSILSLSVLSSSALLGMDNQSFEKLKVMQDIKGKVTANKLIAKNVDLYLVQGIDASQRPFQVIVDKDGNYIILSSKVYDVHQGKQITIPVDLSLLKGQEALTYGTGKNHYYIFTDPECPYCKKFKKTWPNMKDDVTLHIYFYNLSSHTNANAMTRWVLDGASNAEKTDRLFKVANGDKSYKTKQYSKAQMDKYNQIINKHRNLGDTLGVRGVPSVIDSNGENIPWPELKP